MRAFIIACFAAGIIAVTTAVLLDGLMQQSSTAAFTKPGARTSVPS
ncbi:hypothetical protein [Mesorhizobium sp. LNHC209A00]|nr:hypothetical protein [Mesorhizobium sp. LNHC209A00]ESY94358.1 hypothetical protein X738_24610 [Mesorhizobium sp. LNHC209A00]